MRQIESTHPELLIQQQAAIESLRQCLDSLEEKSKQGLIKMQYLSLSGGQIDIKKKFESIISEIEKYTESTTGYLSSGHHIDINKHKGIGRLLNAATFSLNNALLSKEFFNSKLGQENVLELKRELSESFRLYVQNPVMDLTIDAENLLNKAQETNAMKSSRRHVPFEMHAQTNFLQVLDLYRNNRAIPPTQPNLLTQQQNPAFNGDSRAIPPTQPDLLSQHQNLAFNGDSRAIPPTQPDLLSQHQNLAFNGDSRAIPPTRKGPCQKGLKPNS